MAFLLTGAELSPDTHSVVVDSFKNPPSLSPSKTYNYKGHLKVSEFCLFTYLIMKYKYNKILQLKWASSEEYKDKELPK